MHLLYLISKPHVNKKTWQSTAAFFQFLLRVEYSLFNLVYVNMLSSSINKELKTLEKRNIIKKHHRLAYLDLLTYNDTPKPFSTSQELLQRILNLSKRAIREVLSFLESVGLLKRTYITTHNGKRNIPNSITIQLVSPLEIDTTLLTPLDTALLRSLITCRAEFISTDSDKSIASVLVRDVSGMYQGKKFYMNRYLLDYTEENASFIDGLYEGDCIEFSALPDLYKNKEGKERWFLNDAQKFKVI